MKILKFIKNDSLSTSPQMHRNLSLMEKIRNVIGNLFSLMRNHSSSLYSSVSSASHQPTTPPLNLSREILRTLEEEKNSEKSNKDLENITFFFHEAIGDKGIYDVPKNNRIVFKEVNCDEIVYDSTEEHIYEEIEEIPSEDRSPLVEEEPIYEEIDTSYYRVIGHGERISDIPPPLPPRNG